MSETKAVCPKCGGTKEERWCERAFSDKRHKVGDYSGCKECTSDFHHRIGDDGWHDEFRYAGEALIEAMKSLKKLAADLSNSPMKVEDVADARTDWKNRAEAAESQLKTMREALEKISLGGDECGCDHTDENCCAKDDIYCPKCIADLALSTPDSAKPPAGKGEEA